MSINTSADLHQHPLKAVRMLAACDQRLRGPAYQEVTVREWDEALIADGCELSDYEPDNTYELTGPDIAAELRAHGYRLVAKRPVPRPKRADHYRPTQLSARGGHINEYRHTASQKARMLAEAQQVAAEHPDFQLTLFGERAELRAAA